MENNLLNSKYILLYNLIFFLVLILIDKKILSINYFILLLYDSFNKKIIVEK